MGHPLVLFQLIFGAPVVVREKDLILKKTLLLIDGSNFIFRAYHALPPLSTSTGTPTNAIRGFLSMLRVLMKDVPTDYVACVVDP